MAVAAAGPTVGGRFWALASDEDEEDDDRTQPEAPSPSPSDLVCESVLAGYSEQQVANSIDGFVPPSDPASDGLGDHEDDRLEVLRRVVHRRTSSSALRPWKGLIPKGDRVADEQKATGCDRTGSHPGFPSRSGRERRVPALGSSHPGFPSRLGRARHVLALSSMAAHDSGHPPVPDPFAAANPMGGNQAPTNRPAGGGFGSTGAQLQTRGGSGGGTGRAGSGYGPTRGGGGY
ncbi:hypothetical protein ZWY2020_030250 [Hordeum vulgare]|nr:hypothetical protein ZWY2020_030250 [Hordeum vulgare]